MSNPPSNPVSELRALSDLIKASVDKIEAACVERGHAYPLSDLPFTPQSEAIRMAPDVTEEGSIIVAAAAQLIAAVRPPPMGLSATAMQYHVSSCLRAAIRFHVAEILREAGPEGLHIDKIAAPTQVDGAKLARILRVLATKHIFKEVAPDTFAHNRMSSIMDTGKPVSEIIANPELKHDNTTGIPAFLEHLTDDGFKASSFLPDVLEDPAWSHSGEQTQTAMNKAFNTDLPVFEWVHLPENASRRKRFGIAMKGVQSIIAPGAILKGFDWQTLPADAVIVDVGGGIGSQSLTLAKSFDHLKFVVQDREPVIQDAAKFWNSEMGDAISSGRVKLQVHDFFQPQPVQQPAVFFMRMIMHDWSDKYCIQILKHLRAAAGAHTQLVVVDNIIFYASTDPGEAKHIPGATAPLPPAPLLANKGEATITSYLGDMQMLTALNGSERTVAHYNKLYEASGWKLVKAYLGLGFGGQSSKVIGIPA